MNELITWLNANAGAMTALATMVYAVITLFLLFEARSTRVIRHEAQLEAWPTLYGGGLYLATRLENYGPDIARDVRLEAWITHEGKPVDASRRRHAEPLFPAGRHRTFLMRTGDQYQMLRAMAEEGGELRLRWEWSDGRRGGLGLGPPRRHAGESVTALSEFSEGFYEGGALVEKEPLDDFPKLVEHTKKVPDELRRLRNILEGPSMKLWLEEMLQGETEQPGDTQEESGPS
jgi:hypothetical protein